MQQVYLDGLSEDDEVPFRVNLSETAAMAEIRDDSGGMTRKEVDVDVPVIDITSMIAELEANPEARKRR